MSTEHFHGCTEVPWLADCSLTAIGADDLVTRFEFETFGFASRYHEIVSGVHVLWMLVADEDLGGIVWQT